MNYNVKYNYALLFILVCCHNEFPEKWNNNRELSSNELIYIEIK